MRTLRALPTLLRVGVAETVAYRAEFLVWMLTSTIPLIMLALWRSVADQGPFLQYSSSDFVAYFLATLIVRQLTGNWIAWQMYEDIRSGAMSMRLLRPVHPLVAYGASQGAAIPFRSAIAVPVILILLASSGASALTTHPLQLVLVVPSIALAWLISYGVNFALGSVGFWITQGFAIGSLYFSVYLLLSGYMMPLEIMETKYPIVTTIAYASPFPSMLTTPVRLLTRDLSAAQIAHALGVQLAWAVGAIAIALVVWRRGLRRFEAVGG